MVITKIHYYIVTHIPILMDLLFDFQYLYPGIIVDEGKEASTSDLSFKKKRGRPKKILIKQERSDSDASDYLDDSTAVLGNSLGLNQSCIDGQESTPKRAVRGRRRKNVNISYNEQDDVSVLDFLHSHDDDDDDEVDDYADAMDDARKRPGRQKKTAAKLRYRDSSLITAGAVVQR